MMETRNSTTAIVVTSALAFLLSACSSDTKDACTGDNCQTDDSLDSQTKDAGVSAPASKTRDAGGATTGVKSDSASGTKHAGTQADAAVPGAGGALPCDVKELLETYCATCHGASPSFGAQMSLTSLADFAAKAPSDPTQKVSQMVGPRINATTPSRKMPPASSPQLSADELARLNAWLKAGMPAGTEACTSEGAAGGSDGGVSSAGDPHLDPSLTCYKLVAHNGDGKTPFAVGIAKDAYYNLVFKAPWKGTVYARVISPVIDNPKAIHHWLLFQDDSPGTPGAPTSGSGAHPSGQLINGWAPGGQATDFRDHPGDLGMELPGDTTYTVEYHYNSSDASAVDASGVEVCVTQAKPANVVGMSWLGNDNLLVPQTEWTGTCQPSGNVPITIVGVSPHMHKTGVHIKSVINRAGGKTEMLHDADFDFAYQIQYAKNVVINPGDTITTTCMYNQPMTFGESTDAEMCYLFTMAYPKNALSDGLPWGSTAHGGSSCLGQ